ncbi:MAG: hypothetical protein V4747_07585 [Pseudomonadota bacterium]
MNSDTPAKLADATIRKYLSTDESDKLTPGELFLWWTFECQQQEDTSGNYIVSAPAASFDKLCFSAMSNADARSIVRRIVGSKLLANYPLRKEEAYIAGMLLNDSYPAFPVLQKAKPGRKLDENFARNVTIILLARQLRDAFGLKFTRNDEQKSGNLSASDVISSAFISLGHHEVTVRTVKDVLTDRGMRRYVDALQKGIKERKASSP